MWNFSYYCSIIKENHVYNYTDGMHEGIQYFKSHAGRGKFVRLLTLQPDKRFVDNTIQQQANKTGSSIEFGGAKEYNHEYMTVSYICVTVTGWYVGGDICIIGHMYSYV